MILMTQSELMELVEELREMAAAAPTAKVCDVLTKMADRYAARATRAGRTGCSSDYMGAALAQRDASPPGHKADVTAEMTNPA
jgi:hypothetical protein